MIPMDHKQRSFVLVMALVLMPLAVGAADESTEVVARSGSVETLELSDCINLAIQGNDQLQAERHRREELDGLMDQALSTGLPTLDAIGTWNRGRDPSFALDESFGGGGDIDTGDPDLDEIFSNFDFLPAPEDIPAQTFWRASLNMSWTINPTKIMGAIGAAGQGIERQELIMAQTRYAVEEQVISTYHGIVLADEQVRATEAELANQAEFLEIVRMRFDRGMATSLDTLQAAVAVANVEPRVRSARQGLKVAGSRLNATMGRDPEAPLTIRREQLVETQIVNRETALVMAGRRPEVEQLVVMEDLLRQNRKAQIADARPYFTVNSSYGYVGKAISDMNNNGHDFWNASVALNVPLFTGMLTHGRVKETEASIRRTSVERRGLIRNVRVEVLDLLDNLEAAHQNLAAAELNMTRGDLLLDDSKTMMRLGKADYLTVLQSESNRAEARTNLIQARYDVLTLTASLKTAIGVSPMLPLLAVDGLVEGEME